MPKFFNEVWLRDMSPKTMQGVVDFLGKLRVGVRPHNLPGDLQLLAGPWLSNEEAKVYFIFEIDDPTETFEAFAERVADGLFIKTPADPHSGLGWCQEFFQIPQQQIGENGIKPRRKQ